MGTNGRPARDWNHPQAVRLNYRETNPEAIQYHPLIAEREIARLFHSTSRDATHKLVRRCRILLDEMAEDRIVILETGKVTAVREPAIRVLPPENWGPNWNPPKGMLPPPRR